MNKTLYLMRHAEAGWDSTDDSDFVRPLTKKGQKQATSIGQWLQKNNCLPEMIYCSTAKRARQTLALVLENITGPKPTVEFIDALYLAERETLIQVIEQAPKQYFRVMIIGHNPGLEALIAYLNKQTQIINMSPANLALLSYSGEGQINRGCATLDQQISPNS